MAFFLQCLLFIAMLYSGLAWILGFLKAERQPDTIEGDHARYILSEYTFRLGLCFILATGFLSLTVGR